MPDTSDLAATFDQFENPETRQARWEAAAHAAGREVDRNTLAVYMAVADAEQQALADSWAAAAAATEDRIRRLTADLDRAREDLAFMGRATLPELRRTVEHHKNGKQRWRERAERAEARVTELERPAVEAKRNEIRDSFAELAAAAREDRDFEGAFNVECDLRKREEQWAAEEQPTETQGGFELRGTAEIEATALDDAATALEAQSCTCGCRRGAEFLRQRSAVIRAAPARPAVGEQPGTCTATIPAVINSAPDQCVAPAGHYDESNEPVFTGDVHSPGGWHTNGQGHVWSDRAATATPHKAQPETREAP